MLDELLDGRIELDDLLQKDLLVVLLDGYFVLKDVLDELLDGNVKLEDLLSEKLLEVLLDG